MVSVSRDRMGRIHRQEATERLTVIDGTAKSAPAHDRRERRMRRMLRLLARPRLSEVQMQRVHTMMLEFSIDELIRIFSQNDGSEPPRLPSHITFES